MQEITLMTVDVPSSPDIVLSPKRPTKPQLVPFNKNTAALYLRQTENLWLVPNMTRHEASKLLFNRPTGVGAKYTCLIPGPYPIPGNEASCVLTKE